MSFFSLATMWSPPSPLSCCSSSPNDSWSLRLTLDESWHGLEICIKSVSKSVSAEEFSHYDTPEYNQVFLSCSFHHSGQLNNHGMSGRREPYWSATCLKGAGSEAKETWSVGSEGPRWRRWEMPWKSTWLSSWEVLQHWCNDYSRRRCSSCSSSPHTHELTLVMHTHTQTHTERADQ